MLTHARQGRIASASPHCCEIDLPADDDEAYNNETSIDNGPSEQAWRFSVKPHPGGEDYVDDAQGSRPVDAGRQGEGSQWQSGRQGLQARHMPPRSPFSHELSSGAFPATDLSLISSARDLIRQSGQASPMCPPPSLFAKTYLE